MSADPPSDVAVAQPPTAATGASAVSLPADLLADVEREQALADLQAALNARDGEVAQLRADKDAVTAERDGAGTLLLVVVGAGNVVLTLVPVSTSNQLRTQLGSLQSSLLQSNSELSVVQSRIEVG